ncbi:MAG: twin-arginine translocase TatA/TatE family subunit [SAR324 cluster bacterium]|nr:twin-arginine translocase TatA/TatE family subunit [SAR324 cluster bacterium]MBL7035390.1 twin-arginine translocase TatA/TatE family subunit [SAR324 cluster bacterium]
MFGIGLPEMMIIAVVALVFIGPDKLPGVLRSIGKGLVELKRATSDVRSTVQDEMHKIEEEIELKDVRESAQNFSNELGGVANKMEPLSLSKMSSGEQLETIADAIENTEITENTETEDTTETEVTSTKPKPTELSAEGFPAPATNSAQTKDLASVEISAKNSTKEKA